MPLPQTHEDLGSVDVDMDAVASDALDSAPAVDIDGDGDEPAIPLVASRAKPPSVPEESFADLDADFADHAPNAPITPWRGLPALQAESVDITPPRGTPLNAIHFGGEDTRESEPEPTIVGRVPDNLMELSASGGDENTRAFTAPRELIELAKRKREERENALSKGSAAHVSITARPVGRGGASADNGNLRIPAAANVPVVSMPSTVPESDAAPPVARTVSGEMEAVALPSRKAPSSVPPAPSGPEIEIDPGSELSPSAYRAVVAANAKAGARPVSDPVPSDLRRPAFNRGWLVFMGLLVIAGVIIARWRELATLFR